jgi:hypothetical protein
VDGQKVEAPWYSLSETPDTLAVGDVLQVRNEKGGLWLCVRDTRDLVFISRLDTEALIYRQIGSQLSPIGFTNSSYRPPASVIETPKANNSNEDPELERKPQLTQLTPEVVGGLWGIHINWDEDPARALQHVRPDETFCSIRHLTGAKGPRFSAPFRFRYLSLEWTAPHDDSLYSFFTSGLLFLKIGLNGEATRANLDATRLANAADLRIFAFSFANFDRPDALSMLGQLRHLDLSNAQDLQDIPWVTKLSRLRTIDFSGTDLKEVTAFKHLKQARQINLSNTKVKNLSPLSELPALEKLGIEFTPIRSLPSTGFAPLRVLDAFGAKLEAGSLAKFRQSHPACTVRFEWKDVLAEAVQEADRLIIRSGGLCHRRHVTEQILFESRSKDDIQQLIASIEINEAGSDSLCMCCGTPTFEFYRDEKLLESVGVQHMLALRWRSWPVDARLTPRSLRLFDQWMTKRGIPTPEQPTADK